VYTLFEHKSEPEPWVAFQLLRNMSGSGSSHEGTTKETKETQRKAGVSARNHPLVMYQGVEHWEPRELRELLGGLGRFSSFIPNFNYIVYDLGVKDNQELPEMQGFARPC